jgi:hypothetical protein
MLTVEPKIACRITDNCVNADASTELEIDTHDPIKVDLRTEALSPPTTHPAIDAAFPKVEPPRALREPVSVDGPITVSPDPVCNCAFAETMPPAHTDDPMDNLSFTTARSDILSELPTHTFPVRDKS